MWNNDANIEVKDRPPYGKSLFAKRDFKKDDIVFVAFGAVTKKPSAYTIPIDYRFFIEPRVPKGNSCQYICHSCEPNLGVKERSLFVAMRDIKQGEEITIDYAMIGYEYGDELPEAERVCRCGTSTCRGKMGSYRELPEELKRKYGTYISDYLREI